MKFVKHNGPCQLGFCLLQMDRNQVLRRIFRIPELRILELICSTEVGIPMFSMIEEETDARVGLGIIPNFECWKNHVAFKKDPNFSVSGGQMSES